ncbi:MAG: copper-binding protein [Candidatus Acidiferrales bacterium]
MKRVGTIALLLVAALTAIGCSREPAEPVAQTPHWTVKGTIVEIHPEERRIAIDHEDIPGLMAGMTMTFPVAEARLLSGVATGDAVEFDLTQTETGLVVTALRKIDAAELQKTKRGSLSGRGKVVVVNRQASAVLLNHEGLSDGSPGGELMLPVKPPSLLEGISDGDPVEFTVDFTAEYPVLTALKKLKK